MLQPAPHTMGTSAAYPLPENRGLAFPGDEKRGAFEITEAQARRFLAAPNVHGKPNSDVVRPWAGVADILRAPRRKWIIDFPSDMDEREAALTFSQVNPSPNQNQPEAQHAAADEQPHG